MLTHYLWCLHGTSPPGSLPLHHVRPISFQETENQTLPESREVHFLGLGPLSLLLPQCSELKTSFPFEGSISHCQLQEACPAFCHSSKAAEDNQTILCWGTCPARQLLSFQSSNFTPKLPTLVLNCYQLELWTSDLISEWTYVTNRKK